VRHAHIPIRSDLHLDRFEFNLGLDARHTPIMGRARRRG
jgi:hypothetical protein